MMDSKAMRRDGQDNLEPGDQRLFNDGRDAWATNPNDPDPANHNTARDDERDPSEEAETLASNLIGQKPTPDGTKESDSGPRRRK